MIEGFDATSLHARSVSALVALLTVAACTSVAPSATTSAASTNGSTAKAATTTATSAKARPLPTRPTTAPSGLLALTIMAPSHQDTYLRTAFGNGWAPQGSCQNTRAVVLEHQSTVPVVMSSSGCTGVSGRWVDPWSGVVTTTSHLLDIDHTVPLANAWWSGAWSWSTTERVDFANDLVDADHLDAIPAHENRAKGDEGPDLWKPPLRSSWCRYALAWDRIKVKWHLSATPTEWAALRDMVATC